MGVIPLGMLDVPVEPDAPDGRRLLEEELSKTRYQEVEGDGPETPQWIEDLIEWFQSLFDSLGGEGSVPYWVIVVAVVVVALVVVAFLVFGVPRLRRRSGVVRDEGVFEADDVRDGAAMRRDADRAARDGAYALAIAERFRAIARRLHERALVTTVPGSTAHDVARRAADPLPEFVTALDAAAHQFDAVRYLGEPGDAESYARIVALDTELERARPRTAASDPELAEVDA